jgi:hypothetical protein
MPFLRKYTREILALLILFVATLVLLPTWWPSGGDTAEIADADPADDIDVDVTDTDTDVTPAGTDTDNHTDVDPAHVPAPGGDAVSSVPPKA